MRILAALLFVLAAAAPAAAANARVDLEAAQAVLAVQQLDGWLLCDTRGENGIAVELVAPSGAPTRTWCYFIPARGQPSVLVHKSELGSFVSVPGKKIEYTGFRDLRDGMRELLGGAKHVAMEYAPDSGIASLTRVDAATVELVRRTGAQIASSAQLVQLTKSLWGPRGRVAHYVAAHHLSKLREEAIAHVAAKLRAGEPVTELGLQAFVERGYEVRGLVGSVRVASGVHTANPNYAPTAATDRAIQRGDLLLFDLDGKVARAERPIYAAITWVAFVGDEVPERYARVFAAVAQARDAAIDFVRGRIDRRRAVKGFEADQRARQVVGQAGFGEHFVHRTGHSLDTDLLGDGANLDDYESHDTRNLVVGSGFTVGPGLYFAGDFGLRSEVDLHVTRRGVEITSPLQREITPVLGD